MNDFGSYIAEGLGKLFIAFLLVGVLIGGLVTVGCQQACKYKVNIERVK